MALCQIRYLRLFVDSRLVYAPPGVTLALLDEFLTQAGVVIQPIDGSKTKCPLPRVAVNHQSGIKLLRRGKTGLVRFAVGEETPGISRVRMQTGMATISELSVYLIMAVLFLGLNGLTATVAYLRERLVQGNGMPMITLLAPTLLTAAVWFMALTWIMWRTMDCARLPSDFYRYLGNKCGLPHTAVDLPPISWQQFVCFVIAGIGILGVGLQIEFNEVYTRRDKLLVEIFAIASLLYVLLMVVFRRTVLRWTMAQAAVTAALSLSFYWLLPIIGAILLGGDAQRTWTAAREGTMRWDEPWLLALTIVGGLIAAAYLPYLVSSFVKGHAKSIDYSRAHAEIQTWDTPGRRLQLALLVLPTYLLAGLLFTVVFCHCVVFLQKIVLGDNRWLISPALEQASLFTNLVILIVAKSCGFHYAGILVGKIIVAAFSLPVLLWGGFQIGLAVKELLAYAHLWKSGVPRQAQSLTDLTIAINSISRFGDIQSASLRVHASTAIFAYVAISPLPFLPRIVVISNGALKHLPRKSVYAVLAHEIGHIKCGHGSMYTFLRLFSRFLLLGPSALTCLIKPPDKLEWEADSFAVAWLESQGGSREDLIEAIRRTEEQKVIGLLDASLLRTIGVAKWAVGDWLPPKLRAYLDANTPQPLHRRLVTDWRLLQYLAMNCDLATYTHPPLGERLKRIESLPRHEEQQT